MTTSTSTSTSRLARMAAGLLVTVGLLALPAVPAGADGARTDRWAGYRIPETGRAAGGWIGGYRVGRTPVFVITPERRPNRAGVRRANPTIDLGGRGGPTSSETRRAAWVLSKYGGHRDSRQAAAVDAAVLHLLGDRAWSIGGVRGAARVRASGDPATVRRYARLMLRGSRASAGRHRVVVLASTADVGGVTSVTVRVTDGHGGPVSGLPVTVTSPDGGTSQPAAGPVPAVTGDDGRAVVRLAAPIAGWRTVVARVAQVPEHRLRVRGADRRGQAAVAEGGVRRVVSASARVAVRGPQSVGLSAVPTSLTVGAQARVTATVGGDGAARAATARLHGPFTSSSAATCTGAGIGAVSMVLPGDGPHTLPPLSPTAGGYYAWKVDVDGTASTTPVGACGAVVKARARPVVTLAAPGAAAVGNVTVPVAVSGMPFAMRVDLTLKLYGPGDATCSNPIADVEVSHLGDGQTAATMWVDSPGAYSWQVEAAPGDLWQGAESACGAPGSTTQVT